MTSAKTKPDHAIVLAAGLGTRMRPLTNTTPKPLIAVWNKTLLDHAIDALADAEVKKIVVNVHYLADQIEAHISLRQTPIVTISDERDLLLDSAGGVKKALPELGNGAFFLLNADSFWVEKKSTNLAKMSSVWNDDDMDILLLVSSKEKAVGFDGKGDFFMNPAGRLTRRGDEKSAPFIYAGAAILHPRIFANSPDGPFSLNTLFNEAIENGRLYGTKLEGLWLHVGTPASINEAESAISEFIS